MKDIVEKITKPDDVGSEHPEFIGHTVVTNVHAICAFTIDVVVVMRLNSSNNNHEADGIGREKKQKNHATCMFTGGFYLYVSKPAPLNSQNRNPKLRGNH